MLRSSHPVRQWFPPRRGNVVGRAPAAFLILAAITSAARVLHPANPFQSGTWEFDAFASEDQTWLYGPIRQREIAFLTGLLPKRVERVLPKLRKVGLLETWRPEGWSLQRGVFYIVHLPVENAIQRLSASQVRARSQARARAALRASQALVREAIAERNGGESDSPATPPAA